ncbi:hypothetical protein J6590_071631 [Homalodisca vitripennis]|nr:hypothetical protein J6590_071631 [Homalodisca vitripennis]
MLKHEPACRDEGDCTKFLGFSLANAVNPKTLFLRDMVAIFGKGNWLLSQPGQVFARGKFSFDYSSSIVGQVAPPVGQRDLSIQDAVATCFSDVEKSPFGQFSNTAWGKFSRCENLPRARKRAPIT